jgi:hypothetical protein
MELKAQNWAPYNPSNICNYSTSEKFEDIAVIKTNSFNIMGEDTVFYLNRITTIKYTEPYKIISSQFLNSKFRKLDSTTFVFDDPSQYIFKVNAKIGESWIFDSVENITASVSSTGYDSILGQQDSLKYIVLSTTDTILLSKNYGIVSFKVPDSEKKYKLIGIENLGLGYKVPSYLDFFDFEVGDVFEYTETEKYEGRSNYSNNTKRKNYQIKILEKMNPDEKNKYTYKIQKSFFGTDWFRSDPLVIDTLSYEIIETIEYTYDENSFLNYYNKQGIYVYSSSSVNFSKDTVFKVNTKMYYPYILNPRYDGTSYGVGLGMISYHYYEYSGPGSMVIDKNLVGCKKGGIIFGKLTTTSDQITKNEELRLFPNPASEYVNIQIDIPFKNGKILFYDMSGKIVLSEDIANNHAGISIGSLLPGIYQVKVITDKKVYVKSLIKN